MMIFRKGRDPAGCGRGEEGAGIAEMRDGEAEEGGVVVRK